METNAQTSPPFAISQSITTNTNTPILVTLNATDPDTNLLTFSIVTNPTNGILSPIINDIQFITKWGSSGSGDGQMRFPHYVAVDSAGNVYVADYVNDRIQKFSSTGTFITKWGSSGSGDGQFEGPHGIAVDSSGNVYVTDSYDSRIQKFSSTGTFITKWGSFGSGDGQFNQPTGIAVDSAGNVYVTDANNDRIQKFSSTGTFITKWGSSGSGDGQFSEPRGIASDSLGKVYVSDSFNHRIQKFAQPSVVVTYTPNSDFAGSDSFTFKANDGTQDSNIATISVMVLGSSQPVTGQATGQTIILGTCGLSFPNGNNVNYGSLIPNTISAEKKLNMTNSGTVNATLTVSGSNWLDGSSNPQMFVNRTHYNVTSGVAYAQKTPLQTFDQLMKNPFQPSAILQSFWQLEAILLNPSFTGSATQMMDFTVSC